MLEGPEFTAEYSDTRKNLAGVSFTETDRPDVGVGKDCRRDVLVVHFPLASPEQAVHQGHGLTQCDRSELHARSDVSDGVNRWHRTFVAVIDVDRSVLALLDADRLEAQAIDVGHPAGRIKHRVRLDAAAVGQQRAKPIAGFFDRQHVGRGVQIDPVLAHLRFDEAAHVVVEAAQHPGSAVQLGHFRAQPVEDGREFARDVAAANDEQSLRERVEVEHAVGADNQFVSRKKWDARGPPSSDQDVTG